MTPAELAKVRELVGAYREVRMLHQAYDLRDEEDDALLNRCEAAVERHHRAFLAVEAMVATEESAE